MAAPFAGSLLAKPDSKINGVMIGAQTYSFRDRSVEDCVKAMSEIGLSYAELFGGHVDPKGLKGEELKKWRLSEDSMKRMHDVRKLFDDAGVKIYALNYSFRPNWSDEEIARGMEFAKALGTKYITASSVVSLAPRINAAAKKAGVLVAMHNHSNMKEDEYARPEDFAKAMAGNSNIKINLDIGHFTAAGFDPIAYLQEHHNDIVTLHIKDRKKDQGPNMPLGEGDTKIKEVLQVLKTKKYPIPAMIEYEYKGADTVAEVKKCFEYCKSALA